MNKVVGIDLGTTNSVIALMEGGRPVVVPTSEGTRLCPSVVAVNPKTGELLVGQVARRQAITNLENTIHSIKRFMGRKFSDPKLQETLRRVPYKVGQAPSGDVQVWMGGKPYSPPEISAMILRKLKADAEAYVGERATRAVITVPAYFNHAQRQAVREAGRIAGFEWLHLISEAVAASVAYGLGKKDDKMVAVYDLGGGALDVAIVAMGEGIFEVCSLGGDTSLGGDDFDQRVMDWMADEFCCEQGIELRNDCIALQRLKEAAEKAKIELSTVMQTEMNLPFIAGDASGAKHLQVTLTRSKLEQLAGDLVDRSMGLARQALEDARARPSDIDEVVLVGGQTRMPLVQATVRELFGRHLHEGVNPDEAVATGAAVCAGVFAGEVKDVLVLDVAPLTLGVETLGGVATPVIERNTTIPTKRSRIFTTTVDGQTSVEIRVTQGERPLAADNETLGRFIVEGIPLAPRGIPQIEVAFGVDPDAMLHVTARDRATGHGGRWSSGEPGATAHMQNAPIALWAGPPKGTRSWDGWLLATSVALIVGLLLLGSLLWQCSSAGR